MIWTSYSLSCAIATIPDSSILVRLEKLDYDALESS